MVKNIDHPASNAIDHALFKTDKFGAPVQYPPLEPSMFTFELCLYPDAGKKISAPLILLIPKRPLTPEPL